MKHLPLLRAVIVRGAPEPSERRPQEHDSSEPLVEEELQWVDSDETRRALAPRPRCTVPLPRRSLVKDLRSGDRIEREPDIVVAEWPFRRQGGRSAVGPGASVAVPFPEIG